MENYETFVQHRLSQLRKSEEEGEEPSSASSLIRFYGRPILPPLVSSKQREEMRQHRDQVQKASTQKKLKDDPRMAYVQTILHSVQLRTTPTLEELLLETELDTQSSYSHNSSRGSVSQCHVIVDTKESLSPPPHVQKAENYVSLPPLTSTTYRAFFASNVTPQNHEGCLIEHQGSQPSYFNGASHQSSGYVTYENVENATNVSDWTDAESESHGFGCAKGVYNMSGFFLHTTSNTIAKMPDIISHPPIDGEELERSGLERSFCDDLPRAEDVCCISLQEDSVVCDPFPAEKSGSSCPDIVDDDAKITLMAMIDPVKGGDLDQNEGSGAFLQQSCFLDNTELSQVLNSCHSPTTGQHIQHNHREAKPTDSLVDEGDSKPSEKHYRLSLQALLKKSQEYRRRQRMLRNQAKNTKFQDRTQEQPRARVEEQSLSDKENDEFPDKVTVTIEEKEAKERGSTVIRSVETSPKKSWENKKIVESGHVESENSHLTGDENKVEQKSEDKTAFKNKLNSSQQGITKPKPISALIQQQSAGTSHVQDAFYMNTSTRAFYKGAEKYCCVPAPNFCRSPVHCKSKDQIKDGQDDDDDDDDGGPETSRGKYVINIGLNEDHKAEEVVVDHESIHTALPSTVNLTIDGDVTDVLVKSSQHIDQLESNLSSLKVLISDLESTVKENMDSPCQSEFTFKDIKQTKSHVQLGPDNCEQWEDTEKDVDEEEEDYKLWPERQSFHSHENLHRDSGHELSISDDVHTTVQEKEEEMVNLSELRLVKTLVTERENGQGTNKEGRTKSSTQPGGCRKQQPPAKYVQSVAQRMRIPCVFRNVSPETTIPCKVSVLSDTSNHLLARSEMAVDGQDCSPSLNQSYDVDTPSGLWLLDGSGSDLGYQDHLIQKKHLTPESEGEGQGSVSKVKRRLLMHVTDEALERSADTSEGGGSAIRPNSSTPRAAESWYEGHSSQKEKQEQLKLAHAAQVKALQDEHRKQQEELLQALAERYRLLQSVSFPCSMSSSRLGDALTFSTISQPSSSLSQRYRPLLSAAVKGFLTRRLLRTERVAQLVRTIRDTHQFLQQSPGKEELCSRQDVLLQERVSLQLRAARYEVYDIFFSLTARERMQLISWDRELAREKELRRQSGYTGQPGGKSSLSAATQKSLERKRGTLIQKKAAERHRGVTTKTGPKPGSSEQPLGTKRGQCRANPQRVPKSTFSSRPR